MKSTTPKVPLTFKRTKILATLGPATNSYEMIEEMIRSGVNGFRLNFSHGSHEERAEQIKWIRQASEVCEKPVAVLQDLQGPKIRLGEIYNNHFDVHAGDELYLVYGVEHEGATLPVQYDLSQKVQPGERVYLFDGKIKTVTKTVDADKHSITVRVENDGFVMSRKGINLPDTDFGGDVLTPKDYADLDFGATQDIDFVALSFVHQARDVEILRGYLADKGSEAQIIAKIETKTAIEGDELEKIIDASDGAMVARGDLAVEIGAEIVPTIQQRIIGLCQKYGKISIVATQMMSSMVDNPEPTRAEVSDISHAVNAGADCVMLSDETANGSYPLETIQSMKRVIVQTQEHTIVHHIDRPASPDTHSMAISEAAVGLSDQLKADAIIAETRSGATAHHIAAYRPLRPIISVTSDRRVAQQLTLLYANKSFLRPDGEKAGLSLAHGLVETGFLHSGSTVVLVSGQQPGVKGGTDTIRIRTL